MCEKECLAKINEFNKLNLMGKKIYEKGSNYWIKINCIKCENLGENEFKARCYCDHEKGGKTLPYELDYIINHFTLPE